MSMEHLRDPQATSWDDLKNEWGVSPEEQARMEEGASRLLDQVRAYRLAEVRKRQHVTQTDLAKVMGITQARVSHIERGDLRRSEVDTLAAYVAALGGKLKIVADFGEESLTLG